MKNCYLNTSTSHPIAAQGNHTSIFFAFLSKNAQKNYDKLLNWNEVRTAREDWDDRTHTSTLLLPRLPHRYCHKNTAEVFFINFFGWKSLTIKIQSQTEQNSDILMSPIEASHISVTRDWADNRLFQTGRFRWMRGPFQIRYIERSRLIRRFDPCVFGCGDWASFGHPSIHLSLSVSLSLSTTKSQIRLERACRRERERERESAI